MQIGELASRSGISTKTIRYYEDIGLLPPPPRSPSGYRDYDTSTLDRLAFVRAAQAVGLSLGEIRGIVALRDEGQTPCGHVLDLLRTRSAELDRRITELRALQGGQCAGRWRPRPGLPHPRPAFPDRPRTTPG